MKMSLAMLLVMKDTLHGSLAIHADRLGLFKYTRESRQSVADAMDSWFNSLVVDVEVLDESITSQAAAQEESDNE